MLDTKLIGQGFYPEGNARTHCGGLQNRADTASGQVRIGTILHALPCQRWDVCALKKSHFRGWGKRSRRRSFFKMYKQLQLSRLEISTTFKMSCKSLKTQRKTSQQSQDMWKGNC